MDTDELYAYGRISCYLWRYSTAKTYKIVYFPIALLGFGVP